MKGRNALSNVERVLTITASVITIGQFAVYCLEGRSVAPRRELLASASTETRLAIFGMFHLACLYLVFRISKWLIRWPVENVVVVLVGTLNCIISLYFFSINVSVSWAGWESPDPGRGSFFYYLGLVIFGLMCPILITGAVAGDPWESNADPGESV